ncbi:hypothetical protein HK105_200141 [Polyrhizophydium stewartii]|uniref:Uncharacterized protein n=1 Tax=Polyrhizophydium stewartii TaxID=2732419 RepID=A0ABR4NKN4_9FUNG
MRSAASSTATLVLDDTDDNRADGSDGLRHAALGDGLQQAAQGGADALDDGDSDASSDASSHSGRRQRGAAGRRAAARFSHDSLATLRSGVRGPTRRAGSCTSDSDATDGSDPCDTDDDADDPSRGKQPPRTAHCDGDSGFASALLCDAAKDSALPGPPAMHPARVDRVLLLDEQRDEPPAKSPPASDGPWRTAAVHMHGNARSASRAAAAASAAVAAVLAVEQAAPAGGSSPKIGPAQEHALPAAASHASDSARADMPLDASKFKTAKMMPMRPAAGSAVAASSKSSPHRANSVVASTASGSGLLSESWTGTSIPRASASASVSSSTSSAVSGSASMDTQARRGLDAAEAGFDLHHLLYVVAFASLAWIALHVAPGLSLLPLALRYMAGSHAARTVPAAISLASAVALASYRQQLAQAYWRTIRSTRLRRHLHRMLWVLAACTAAAIAVLPWWFSSMHAVLVAAPQIVAVPAVLGGMAWAALAAGTTGSWVLFWTCWSISEGIVDCVCWLCGIETDKQRGKRVAAEREARKRLASQHRARWARNGSSASMMLFVGGGDPDADADSGLRTLGSSSSLSSLLLQNATDGPGGGVVRRVRKRHGEQVPDAFRRAVWTPASMTASSQSARPVTMRRKSDLVEPAHATAVYRPSWQTPTEQPQQPKTKQPFAAKPLTKQQPLSAKQPLAAKQQPFATKQQPAAKQQPATKQQPAAKQRTLFGIAATVLSTAASAIAASAASAGPTTPDSDTRRSSTRPSPSDANNSSDDEPATYADVYGAVTRGAERRAGRRKGATFGTLASVDPDVHVDVYGMPLGSSTSLASRPDIEREPPSLFSRWLGSA